MFGFVKIIFVMGIFYSTSLLVPSDANAYQTNFCHTILENNNVSAKYGLPVNFFSSTTQLSISAKCSDSSVTIGVGNGDVSQYIYKYGYRKINGKWVKISLKGDKTKGSWFIGNATATFTDNSKTGKGEVLAYICQKVDGVWKCGCGDKECKKRKWQIQKYDLNKTNINNQSCDVDGVSDIHYPSRYITYPGEKITLYGSGFETCAVTGVFWNAKMTETNLMSKNEKELVITVPDFKPGKYEVYTEEDGKKSEYSTVIWIGANKDADKNSKPNISNILPKKGKQGDKFTIYGSNFTDYNDVITTFGIVSGLKSDNKGTEISFIYNPFTDELKSYDENTLKRITYTIPVYVTVMNVNGQSTVSSFELDI